MAALPDVSVLNCGAGDMTFSFDPANPLEVARASRVVKDMLARGYMLFAKVEEKLTRITRFDESTYEYIIADGPEASPMPTTVAPSPPPAEAITPVEPTAAKRPTLPPPPPPKRGRPVGSGKRLKAHGTPVTGIAPTAGG